MLLVAHRTPASAPGCARLAAAGATVFEVDVQLDRGHVVVSHYHPFGRMGLVQRDNWRFRPAGAAVRDPKLVDVSRCVPAGATILLDVKEKAPDDREALIDALASSLPDRARYRVCGPDLGNLERLRSLGFATWRTVGDARELAAVLAEPALADEAVTVRHALLTDTIVEQLHERAGCVVAWTVNSRRRARRLQAMGVDGITTDRVATLAAILTGRADADSDPDTE